MHNYRPKGSRQNHAAYEDQERREIAFPQEGDDAVSGGCPEKQAPEEGIKRNDPFIDNPGKFEKTH